MRRHERVEVRKQSKKILRTQSTVRLDFPTSTRRRPRIFFTAPLISGKINPGPRKKTIVRACRRRLLRKNERRPMEKVRPCRTVGVGHFVGAGLMSSMGVKAWGPTVVVFWRWCQWGKVRSDEEAKKRAAFPRNPRQKPTIPTTL